MIDEFERIKFLMPDGLQICEYLQEDWECVMSGINREVNGCADAIAKEARFAVVMVIFKLYEVSA